MKVAMGFALLLALWGCDALKTTDAEPDPAASGKSDKKKEEKEEEKGVRITAKAPKAGDKRSQTSAMTMNLKMAFAGKNLEVDMSEDEKKREEVLDAEGSTIKKVKVTYESKNEVKKEQGRESKKTSPISGKTYVVEKANNVLKVTTEAGAPAPANEAKIVAKDFDSLGEPDPILEAIPKEPLAPGQRVPQLEAAFKDFFAKRTKSANEREKIAFDEVKVTFKDKSGDVAIFELALTMKMDAKIFVMTTPLSGTMGLRMVDGQPASVELAGPISMGEPDGKGGIKPAGGGPSGSGKMRMTFAMTYP